jgi:hypothetical protein
MPEAGVRPPAPCPPQQYPSEQQYQSEQANEVTPVGVRPRYRYDRVIALLKAAPPGEWVQLDPDEIGGNHPGSKQGRLNQAAKQRGLRVTSVFREPGVVCYAKLLDQPLNALETAVR